MPLKVLIVDDEAAARARLRAQLRETGDVELLGECGDGLSALRVIRERAPDVVLLDVEMPGLDGFGVLDAIATERPPRVILLSEVGSYGRQACERHGLDHLLKPVERESLARALAGARDGAANGHGRGAHAGGALAIGAGHSAERIAGLLAELRREGRLPDTIVIRDRGRITHVRPAEIDWVEAAGNYVALHCGAVHHLLRETMKGMEGRLDERTFVRVHRSKIVNLDRVRGLEPTEHGEYLLTLEGGGRLRTGRGFTDRLREKLPETGRAGGARRA